jgi:pimeloyl-ACP methyl ester carboxylesterase
MGRNKMDYQKLREVGVKARNGIEQERVTFRRLLRMWEEGDSRLQLEQLSLSRNSRCVLAEESGHDVHLTQPAVVADATR